MLIKVSEIKENTGRREAETYKVKELAESIEQIGLINPITVTEFNNQYMLVAGLHRLEAYKLLNRKEIEANVIKGTELELELVEIDENLIRNELHYIDLDDLTIRRKVIYEKMHPETKDGGDRGNQYTGGRRTLCPSGKPTFSKDTATKTGESERNVRRSIQRAREIIPEAKPILKEKEITKTEATELARKTPEEQKKIIDVLKEGKASSINQAYKSIRREERKKSMQVKPLPVDKYHVIYCDPPWQYSNDGFAMSAENQYPTVPTEKLKKMEIGKLANENAVMFMWATNPLLKDALELMEAWGFEYKTNFVWTKERHTAGFYVFGQHELLLIGVKGSMLPIGEKTKSIITGANNVHSKKPETTYSIIEKMYPKLKYIELFARNKREGWESWGNEV
ncbi:MAG TPA: MT-A70 family methyltransferase [Syntrophomonadaceae bacterium]|nr:MT-A70 family methyltransferase [Syntrophomonadaceae bacterium]